MRKEDLRESCDLNRCGAQSSQMFFFFQDHHLSLPSQRTACSGCSTHMSWPEQRVPLEHHESTADTAGQGRVTKLSGPAVWPSHTPSRARAPAPRLHLLPSSHTTMLPFPHSFLQMQYRGCLFFTGLIAKHQRQARRFSQKERGHDCSVT